MTKIIGLDGKPMNKQAPQGEESRVICDILMENPDAAKLHKGIMAQTPKGPMLVPVEQMLSGVLFNLYGIMHELKQKTLMISIVDVSSPLVQDKNLVMRLLPMPEGGLPDEDLLPEVEEDKVEE